MIRKLFSNRRILPVMQLLVMLVLSLCSTLLPLIFPGAYAVLTVLFQWILAPAAGAATACLLAKSGVNAYLSWLLPPAVHTVVPWLIWGYLPPFLSMLLCALISLTGAAAGDVLARRK